MTRRTKQQKMHAAQKRQEQLLTYSYQSESGAMPSAQRAPEVAIQKSVTINANSAVVKEIFGYDIHLIYRDLRKTVIITVLIICFLFAIFFLIQK